MKQLTPLAISALLLLTACGQVESAPDNQTALPPPTMQEERQAMHADTQMQSILEEQTAKEQQTQPNPQQTTAAEVAREAAAVQTASLPDTAAENPEPTTAAPTPPQDIPSATVHAKTGYVEPEPEPTPEPDPAPVETADRQVAMDVANTYAVGTYGVETDTGLTLDNSAYRFPAAVPTDATQATLEAKARDMVDFTFRQLMMQAGVDTLADAGFRCNVCIMEDGGSLLIYVLYDG